MGMKNITKTIIVSMPTLVEMLKNRQRRQQKTRSAEKKKKKKRRRKNGVFVYSSLTYSIDSSKTDF